MVIKEELDPANTPTHPVLLHIKCAKATSDGLDKRLHRYIYMCIII